MSRILVIEDELGAQQLLRARLRDLGHDVTVKETGAQGIAEAKTSSFDLYLVDMHLGSGVDGIEVCRRMKRDPETRAVPVVLLSGKVRSSADLHRGYEAGCESFMVKDDMSLVDDVIRAMLRIKSLGDELSAQMAMLHQRNDHLQKALEDKALLEDQIARTSNGVEFSGTNSDIPAGILLVDPEGIVDYADRGAREIFAKRIEGRNLGNLAPGTRLEAFVRNASAVARTGFRFTIAARGSRPELKLVASVMPLVPTVVGARSDLRAVLLHDVRRQALEADLLQIAANGVKLEECADLHELARREYRANRLVGNCPVISSLRERTSLLANHDCSILVTGEEGTGKRHLARVLHYSSDRTGAFIPVCFEAVGRGRLGAELFGDEEHASLLLQASGGTLFLEGVEKMSTELQQRLVDTLKKGELVDPQSGVTQSFHVRLIASNLGRGDADSFLPALRAYFTEHYELSALRERSGDIALLARSFLDQYGLGGGAINFSEDAWLALESYDWPGNLAELNNVISRACARTNGDRIIEVSMLAAPLPDLHARILERGEFTPTQRPDAPVPGTHHQSQGATPNSESHGILDEVMSTLPESADGEDLVSFDFFEKWALTLALVRSKGDRLKAAEMLKVGKSTLYRKLHKYDLH
ncbi:MAG: DNA-binding NtrC family response regulator [Planctomycetota bacterium]